MDVLDRHLTDNRDGPGAIGVGGDIRLFLPPRSSQSVGGHRWENGGVVAHVSPIADCLRGSAYPRGWGLEPWANASLSSRSYLPASVWCCPFLLLCEGKSETQRSEAICPTLPQETSLGQNAVPRSPLQDMPLHQIRA